MQHARSGSAGLGAGDYDETNAGPGLLAIKNSQQQPPPQQLLINRIHMGLDEPELVHIGQKLIKGRRVLKKHGQRRWTYKVPQNEQRAKLHR